MKYWWNCLTTNFANFSGRARRAEVWSFFLMNVLVSVVLMFLTFFVLGLVGSLLSGLFSLWALIPGIALVVRRLHDTGRSGWWYFISLVPIIGFIWFFILVYCIDSQPGTNEYGPNPKGM